KFATDADLSGIRFRRFIVKAKISATGNDRAEQGLDRLLRATGMSARAAESGAADAGRGGGREVDAEADHGLREDAKGLLRHRESRRRASCAQCAAECAGARRLGSAGGSA